MSDDDLLERLVDTARAEKEGWLGDPRWETFAAGALGEQDLERLLASVPQDERQQARAAFAPLEVAARERIAGAVVAELERGRVVAAAELPPAVPATNGQKKSEAPRIARTWRLRSLLLTVPMAAAAALLLWPRSASVPLLPAYDLEFSAGPSELRASPPEVSPADEIQVDPHRGGRMIALLRPRSGVQSHVAVAAFRMREGKVERWPVPFEVSPQGAIRIAGPTENLLAFQPGRWELVFVLAAPNSLPSTPGEVTEALADPAQADRRGWRLLRKRIEIRGSP